MEKRITREEESRANKIKGEFIEVHDQISEIQKEMDLLNERSKFLIGRLETLREDESKFILSLEEKYGQGTLDPFKMIYKIKENENVS